MLDMALNHMTRLMCSRDREELEALKSKLFRAGIRSEICSNPVANALGIVRLEINIYDSDFVEASRIHQEFLTARSSDDVPTEVERGTGNGRVGREEIEVLVEPETAPSSSALAQLAAPICSEQPKSTERNRSGGELAQAAVLLEKELEEVLARDDKLVKTCAALQEQIKALAESLAQVKAELAREISERSVAQQKLAEAGETRELLEKELDGAKLRLKNAEQSLSAAQGRLESQTRDLKVQQAKVGDLSKEIAARDSQLSTLAESLAQARASLEKEKGLRQVAEQEMTEHAAVRKSLEQQVDHFAELQAQIQQQNQQEREQIQASLETLNRLRSRLSQKRATVQER